eukprot:365857-Chlamydomonas_euryale.AAC.10
MLHTMLPIRVAHLQSLPLVRTTLAHGFNLPGDTRTTAHMRMRLFGLPQVVQGRCLYHVLVCVCYVALDRQIADE